MTGLSTESRPSKREFARAGQDDAGLHRLFERQAERSPNAIAVVEGTRRHTYRELNEAANRLARHLRAEGVSHETLVGVCFERSFDLIASILAVLKAGGAYVPLDPDYPAERLGFVIADAALSVVVTGSSLRAGISLPDACRLVSLEGSREAIASQPATNLDSVTAPDDLLYLIYTSGSTGAPKGVMVTHRNVVRLFEMLGPVLDFSARDGWSFYHSPAFGYSAWEIWGPLVHGGRLVVVPSVVRMAPGELRDLLKREGVTVLSLTPSAFRQVLLDEAFQSEAAVSTLRMIALSGEPVAAADLRRWFASHRPGHPHLIDTYAITETGGQVAWRRLTATEESEDSARLLGEILGDTEVHLLDGQLRPVPAGSEGELCISGPGLARGYWNRADLTAERFVTDAGGRRVYRTGDRGRLRPDGRISLLGRNDDQVKVRGHRIELGEIEAALRSCPGVTEAAVLLRQDDGTDPRLVAYVCAGGRPAASPAPGGQETELWPSLGEYQVYDEVLYYFMTSEDIRNAAYREAIRRHVRDKVVLDIGTGQDAILARFCVEAGARRVYAIEVLEDACEKAAKLVEQLGLSEQIKVIFGDSTTVDLPEPVDVCTEGIIGNIGSSDGIIPIMNDARRWFAPGAVAIPCRCTTHFAAVQLPDALAEKPRFGALPRHYTESIFSEAGGRFDIRLCVRNFPKSHLLSKSEVFEDLDFQGWIDPADRQSAEFVVDRDGRFDGFLLWTYVLTAEGVAVDYLENQQAWLPVYFPISDDGVLVRAGDRIEASWERTLSENGINPDYSIRIVVKRAGAELAELSYTTRHRETAYLSTGIHRRLFANWDDPPAELSPESLRAHLSKSLPDYMIPSVFLFLERLPRNANGKLDRQALPAPGSERPALATQFSRPETALQGQVAAIWRDVLKLEEIGLDDSFFDLGGHSLAAAQIMARIRVTLSAELPLSAIFDHPTVRELSLLIEKETAGEEFSGSSQGAPSQEGSRDEEFMRLAVEQATKALGAGEVPFGACIVRDGEVVASVANGVSRSCDATAHAEVRAIREACNRLGTTDLSGCTVYSTCEPCPMCFSACHEARVSRIVHGVWLSDAENVGLGTLSVSAEQLRSMGRASLTLTPGVLREDVLALLNNWQVRRRKALDRGAPETEHPESLYGGDEGFEAYTLAVDCSNLLDQAMSVLDPILEKHPAGRAFRFLDIGSGTGTLTVRVVESLVRRGVSVRVDCVEPSAPAMALLENRLNRAGLGRSLGDRHVQNWETAAEAIASAGSHYDLILAHHSLYYIPLDSGVVRGLGDLLASGGRAVIFMDDEGSPIALVREVVGRGLHRKSLQLSSAGDLDGALSAARLSFDRRDLEVNWDVSPLFEQQHSPRKDALTAFLSLTPPAEITPSIARMVTEETRAVARRNDKGASLSQRSRVFVIGEPGSAMRGLSKGGGASHEEAGIRCDPDQRHEPFPMTEIQAAYWVGKEGSLQLGNVATHVYEEIDCRDLDLGRLEDAWQELVRRHDMLRAIVQRDGLLRVIEGVPPYRFQVSDLRAVAGNVDHELARIREAMSHQVRRSDEWPPFEIRAARLSDNRVRIMMSYDVIFMDGWSRAILLSEWKKLYEDPETSLPRLELTFRDYALAAARSRQSDACANARAYWQARLEQLPPAPRLPLACDPEELSSPRFNRRSARLQAEEWTSLKRRATRAGVTASSALLAAFSDILHLWSEEPGFCLNLSLFNREPLHPQVNEIVGDFTSVVIVEVAPPESAFAERARRVQRQVLSDLDHRQFSGIEVQRDLLRKDPEKYRAGMPVVFTSLLWNDPGVAARSVGHWMGETVFGVSQTPQVWIDCVVYEDRGALVMIWDAIESLFPTGVLDAMFAAFVKGISALAGTESAWTEEWTDAGRRLVPTVAAGPKSGGAEAALGGLLHEAFFARASETPDAVGVISGACSLSYKEIAAMAKGLAARLRELGAKPGSLVAIVMDKGWEQVVAALGVLRAGAAYLPIDAALPPDRLRKLLELGEVRIALTQSPRLGAISWPKEVLPVAVTADGFPAGDEAVAPAKPEDLAYVIFTSGSTGEPKGVMIRHEAAVNTIIDINSRFAVTAQDRILALSSLTFDLSVYDIFGALAAGAAIVIPDPDGVREPSHWADLVHRHGVTIWNSVPALLDLYVDYLRVHPDARPESLRLALLSGDWIPVALPDAIRSHAPSISVISLGGATEASIWSILHEIGAVSPDWTSIPYGRAMANQSVTVLDAHLLPRPAWVPGELFIGGVGLADGYWRDPDATRASFIQHPFTGERLYRTGDMGRYLPDGNIEFLGRKDLQVKLQGFRVELGEIEAVLCRDSSVATAAVVARGSREAAKKLVAYVVARRGTNPQASELQTCLAEKLPQYMVPSSYVFLDALPLSSNGKVDRKALPEDTESRAETNPPSASRDDFVEEVRELVAAILGAGDLDPEANLLELGATSIDMIRIINRIDEAFGHRPRIGDFYRAPSVAGLAGGLRGRIAIPEQARGPKAARSVKILTDPEERESFKATNAGRRRFPAGAVAIALAKTEDPGGRLYAHRRSHREFLEAPVPFAGLSALLRALCPRSDSGSSRYLFGSAGGAYPVQTYLYAKPGRLESVPAGAYYFDPIDSRLVLVSGGACIDADACDFLVNKPIFEKAAFAVFLVAQLHAIEPLYGEHSLAFATIEAGLMTQLIETTAPSCGLGLCQIGGIEDADVRRGLAFESGHVLVHSLLGGLIAGTQPSEATVGQEWLEGEV